MEMIADSAPAEIHLFQGEGERLTSEKETCAGHFIFIFVRSGIFKAIIDGTRISCTSDELVIALCRNYYQVVKYRNAACYLVTVQWQFLTDIKMSSRFIDLLVSRHILKTVQDSFDSKVMNRITKLLYHYYQCIRNPVRFPEYSFHAALSLLVFQAAWQQDSEVVKKGTPYSRKELLAMQFLKLLVQHYREDSTIGYYAGRLCVTNGYLNKAVREVTGRTTGKCIAEIIISEAKYLLLRTDLTIEAISEQLHFTSAGSFSRFFKNNAALSPTEYRRDHFD